MLRKMLKPSFLRKFGTSASIGCFGEHARKRSLASTFTARTHYVGTDIKTY